MTAWTNSVIASRPAQRGIALLIVLAVLVLTVTASASLARLASTTVLRRAVDQQALAANDLSLAADAAIRHWLEAESANVVLPADARRPCLEVCNDLWTAGETACRLRISAWDQCGMTPIGVLDSASPLRMAIPPEVAQWVKGVDHVPEGATPGLDMFTRASDVSSVNMFPMLAETAAAVFGDMKDEHTVDIDAEPRDAVGAFIATHHPMPGAININTAPMPLVESALRLGARGGIEQVIASRTAGKSAAVASLPSWGSEMQFVPRIVGRSHAWAFRIDITVHSVRGTVRRSWWSVYVLDASRWRCAQRLAITE